MQGTPDFRPGWPLRTEDRVFPDAPGQFGAVRRYDVHTGVDLYCAPGTEVIAMEPGRVVGVEPFTGAWVSHDPSPWWNDTAAILVQGASGMVVYGEVSPEKIQVRVWETVTAGQGLGWVDVPVLRRSKGRPTVMLHLELYTSLAENGEHLVWWRRGEPCPTRLRDPTFLLWPWVTRHFQSPRGESGSGP